MNAATKIARFATIRRAAARIAVQTSYVELVEFTDALDADLQARAYRENQDHEQELYGYGGCFADLEAQ